MSAVENIPFTLHPIEVSVNTLIKQIDNAITAIEEKQESISLIHLNAFLKEIASVNDRKFKSFNGEKQERFVSVVYWVVLIRRSIEDSKVDFNPKFPTRICPWLHGKTLLFAQIARNPSNQNAIRALQFLKVWRRFAQEHQNPIIL